MVVLFEMGFVGEVEADVSLFLSCFNKFLTVAFEFFLRAVTVIRNALSGCFFLSCGKSSFR